MSVLPEKDKKKIFLLKKEVSPIDINNAENELSDWESKIKEKDSSLKTCEKTKEIFEVSSVKGGSIPAPRGTQRRNIDTTFTNPKPSGKLSNLSADSKAPSAAEKKERISGYDFGAWEKFDVDSALAQMDEDEAQVQKTTHEQVQRLEHSTQSAKAKREQRFQVEMDRLRDLLSTSSLSVVQRAHKAGASFFNILS